MNNINNNMIQCCGSPIEESNFKKHFEENDHKGFPILVIGPTVVRCFCGSILKKSSLKKHMMTTKHLKYSGHDSRDWYDQLLWELHYELIDEINKNK
jgi:hypothetical protein